MTGYPAPPPPPRHMQRLGCLMSILTVLLAVVLVMYSWPARAAGRVRSLRAAT